MNRNTQWMRDVFPVEAGPWRCHIEGIAGEADLLTFHLETQEGAEPKRALSLTVERRQAGEGLCRADSGRTYPFAWAWVGPELHLWLDGDLFVFGMAASRRRNPAASPAGEGEEVVLAPMPGAVLDIRVQEGDSVEAGQTLLIMESMKMELVISAARDGVVRRVAVQPGQQVERGVRLLELEPQRTANSGEGE